LTAFQIAQVIEEIHHYQQNKYALEPDKNVRDYSIAQTSQMQDASLKNLFECRVRYWDGWGRPMELRQ